LVLESLPEEVVEADITVKQYSDAAKLPIKDLNSFAGDLANVLVNIPKDGQAEHFQAYQGQDQAEAFRWGVAKIAGNTQRAIGLFREWPPSSKFNDFEALDGDKESAKRLTYARRVSQPLAHAIHPLQDSFSPGHVVREKDGDQLKIRKITVWREQEKKVHKQGDESWRDQPGSWGRDCADAARDATEILLNYFLYSVLYRQAEAEKARDTLLYKYFCFEPVPWSK
jgi:hypothetical protein